MEAKRSSVRMPDVPGLKSGLTRVFVSFAVAGVLVFLSSEAVRIQAQDAAESEAALDSEVPAVAIRIDSLITLESLGQPALPLDDATLLRRVYLQLIGLPPSLDEIDNYLNDPSPDRYAKLIDDLLDRAEFSEHWADRLDVLLMERRANTNIPQDQWIQWLRDQVTASRPLNELFADLIVADGAPGAERPKARFLLDRGADPHLITRDIGRIFFGRDLQCAQCHDHPSIDSYLQTDYHGLLGFVASLQSTEVTEGETKLQMIAEKSSGDAPFESVFRRGTMHRVLPHLFDAEELAQPWSIPGEDYQPVSTPGHPVLPIHSRRQQLADAIRKGDLEPFNRNLANRLWTSLFGRGLVEPVDLQHAANPPLSEPMLELITNRLVQEEFDLRRTLRQIALTDTFRRGSLNVEYDSADEPQWLRSTISAASERMLTLPSEIESVRSQSVAAESSFVAALESVAPMQAERLTLFGNVDTARTAHAQAVDALNKVTAEKVAAEQALQVAKDKQAKLQAAADSTALALQSVGEDAELSAAVELLKSRVAVVLPTIAPLEQTLNDKIAALQAPIDAVTAARATLLAAQGVAEEANGRYQAATVAVRDARIAMDKVNGHLAKLESVNGQLKTILAWTDWSNQWQLAQSEHEQAAQSLNALKVQEEERTGAVTATLEQISKLGASVESALAEETSARQQMATLDTQLSQLTNAKESLQTVASLVKSPQHLESSVNEIQTTFVSIQQGRSDAERAFNDKAAMHVARQQEVKEQQSVLVKLQQQLIDLQQQQDLAMSKLAEQESKIAGLQEQRKAVLQSIQQVVGQRFQAARLTPLSPEQIGWSALGVTNVYRNYVDKHLAELEKESPATEAQLQDPAFVNLRRSTAVRRARAELQGNINVFISLYGAGAGQPQNDFFATADQALYTSNGGAIFAWAAPSTGNVTQRIIEAPNATDAANILYRGLFCREPSASEIAAVEQFLGQVPDSRPRLAQEMVWSLMASAEFRFLQ